MRVLGALAILLCALVVLVSIVMHDWGRGTVFGLLLIFNYLVWRDND